MLKILLSFFIAVQMLWAIDVDKKAVTLGTFYTKQDAEYLARKFSNDNIYIKISEKNQKMVFVVYSMDIPYGSLSEYLAKYRQTVPSAYVTPRKNIKRLAKFEEQNSSALYRYPLSKKADDGIKEKTKTVLKSVVKKVEEKVDVIKKLKETEDKKIQTPVKKESEKISEKEEAPAKLQEIETTTIYSSSSDVLEIEKNHLILLLVLNVLVLLAIYFISGRKGEKEPDTLFGEESFNQDELNDLKKAREKAYADLLQYEKRLKVIKNEINLKTKGKFTHRIYSAKEFYDLSDIVVNMARREDIAVSIMFIHIKNFDVVNQEGDLNANNQFITNFISILDFHTRESDIISRLTNAEFALLLPYTDKKGAEILKEKLLKKGNNQTVFVGDKAIKLEVDSKIDIVNTQLKESTYEALERVEKDYYKKDEV